VTREAGASADMRPQEGRAASRRRRPDAVAGVLAALDRARGHLHRMRSSADLAGFRGVGLAWFTIAGLAVAVCGVLQALGPPAAGPVATVANAPPTTPAAVRGMPRDPHAQRLGRRDAASGRAPPDVSALLARVEAEIIDTPDGPSPGTDAARTLQRVADALPNATPAERDLANKMAASLYDRAKSALDGGRIDEEQRWLALGAMLAPPPDMVPGEPQLADRATPSATEQPGPEPQDVTPNEAEAEDNAQAAQTATPTVPSQPERAPASGAGQQTEPQAGAAPATPGSPAAGTEATAAPQPAPADRATAAGGLPELRPPGAPPPTPDQRADAAKPDAAQPAADPGGPDAAGPDGGVAIHFLAGSEFAETRAKALAERIGGAFGPVATRSAADVPPGAVIRYSQHADHARARELGAMLGSMGYPWRLQRSPDGEQVSGMPGLDVWLPPGEPVRMARARYVVVPRFAAAWGRPRGWWSFLIPPWF
jgi:hypothetical protein